MRTLKESVFAVIVAVIVHLIAALLANLVCYRFTPEDSRPVSEKLPMLIVMTPLAISVAIYGTIVGDPRTSMLMLENRPVLYFTETYFAVWACFLVMWLLLKCKRSRSRQ